MTTRLWTGLVLVGVGLLGCNEPPTPEYPSYRPPRPAEAPGRGFLAYASAADQVESLAKRHLTRVHFTPGIKMQLVQALGAPLQRLAEGAASDDVSGGFVPTGPFEAHPHHAGWRLLGKALRWKAEAAGAEADYDGAIRSAVLATTFGFDLSRGSATDADLGLTIADEARAAILPLLSKMSPEQLALLRDGMKRALGRKPTLVEAVRNERDNMLCGVDAVQQAYRDNRLEDLQKRLGPEVRDAIVHLREMKNKDREQRPSYFKGFAAEAESEVDWLARIAVLPAAKREMANGPKLASDRPWRRLAKQLFRTCRPLLDKNDATLARTRLLILQAEVLKQIRSAQQTPRDLSRFPGELKQDPYTGLPFVYKAEGTVFYLYSMGDNFRDDGGDTDAAFRRPDLLLERPTD